MTKLSCGRKEALLILKSFGGKFRKKTALTKLDNAGCSNPEGKFLILLKKGFIEKTSDGCYQVK